MEEAKTLIQQQLMLQQQIQAQQQQQHHLSLLQQQAISLNHPPPRQHHQPQPQPQSNPNFNPGSNVLLQQMMQNKEIWAQEPANQAEMQMAYQDAWRVCHPDFNRPFSSLEDACDRLLPYHVVADYEAEEDDRILYSDTTSQVLSRSQQWDNNIAAKVAEFTTTFEKQVLAFNIISRKLALGEFRSEERLMMEKFLFVEEKEAAYKLRTEIESREVGLEAQLRMAAAMIQAGQAHGDPQASKGPLRGSAAGYQGSDHEMNEGELGANNPVEMVNGYVQRHQREPSEDFLNDEDPDNGETNGQYEWREVSEFDLNTR